MFSVWAGIFAADQSCALVTWKHVCALLVPALPPPTPKTKEVFVPHSAVLCCNLKCLLLMLGRGIFFLTLKMSKLPTVAMICFLLHTAIPENLLSSLFLDVPPCHISGGTGRKLCLCLLPLSTGFSCSGESCMIVCC